MSTPIRDLQASQGTGSLGSDVYEEAARKIQCCVRTHMWRGEHLLPESRYIDSPYLQDPELLTTQPHPDEGVARQSIYLPEGSDLVWRRIDTGTDLIDRFDTKITARQVCLDHGLTHLVVPKGVYKKGFVIEERVPTEHVGAEAGMRYYQSNPGRLTSAVKEFTTFLSKIHLGDLLAMGPPSFDNILLFEDKIGLVDLDTLGLYPPDLGRACHITATIFPYHIDEILEVGGDELSAADAATAIRAADKGAKIYETVLGTDVSDLEF